MSKYRKGYVQAMKDITLAIGFFIAWEAIFIKILIG